MASAIGNWQLAIGLLLKGWLGLEPELKLISNLDW